MKKKEAFLYQTTYEQLKRNILDGVWLPDAKLPAERELGELVGASTITVKRALEMLCEEGTIYRIQGRGTFVCRNLGLTQRQPTAGRLVGLVLEHVSSPYGLTMMYQMIQELELRGYRLCIRFSFGDPAREAGEIDALIALGISGLIVMPCHDSYYSMSIVQLMLKHFPIVLVDKKMHGLPISSVCTDGSGAIRSLVQHLHAQGSRSIALITLDPDGTTSLKDRIRGFHEGMAAAGLVSAGELILPKRTMTLQQTGKENEYTDQIAGWLETAQPKPDALICTEYALARALFDAVQRRGMAFGPALRACCIDEDEVAAGGYTFTHMKQDEPAIAKQTVRILMDIIENETGKSQDVRVPAQFRLGQTT